MPLGSLLATCPGVCLSSSVTQVHHVRRRKPMYRRVWQMSHVQGPDFSYLCSDCRGMALLICGKLECCKCATEYIWAYPLALPEKGTRSGKRSSIVMKTNLADCVLLLIDNFFLGGSSPPYKSFCQNFQYERQAMKLNSCRLFASCKATVSQSHYQLLRGWVEGWGGGV